MTAPPLAVKLPDYGRGYKHPVTGDLVPSVTTILNVVDKPALPRWAAKTTAEFAVKNLDVVTRLALDDPRAAVDMIKGSPWRSRDDAAGKGTDAHSVAEKILRKEASIDAVFQQPGNTKAVENVLGVLRSVSIDPVAIEATVWSHEHGYAGTCDLVCVVDGETWLADWKSGSGVYPDMALQLAAYRYADVILFEDGTEVAMPPVDRAMILHVPKTGRWSIVELSVTEREFQAFLACKSVWQWQADRSKHVVGQKAYRG